MTVDGKTVRLRVSCNARNESKVRCSQHKPTYARGRRNGTECIYGLSRRTHKNAPSISMPPSQRPRRRLRRPRPTATPIAAVTRYHRNNQTTQQQCRGSTCTLGCADGREDTETIHIMAIATLIGYVIGQFEMLPVESPLRRWPAAAAAAGEVVIFIYGKYLKPPTKIFYLPKPPKHVT
jgi:hypothetical protein